MNLVDSEKTQTAEFNYQSYKRLVVTEDVKRLKKAYKPRWYENIFLFGCIAYLIRVGFAIAAIDRGTLRRNIDVSLVIWLGIGLIYITIVVMLLTPWVPFSMYRRAVKKTEIQLKDDQDL